MRVPVLPVAAPPPEVEESRAPSLPTRRGPRAQWLVPPPGGLAALTLEVDVALRLKSGAVYVGRPMAVTSTHVLFRRWGAPGDLRIRREQLFGCATLKSHTHVEAVEVRKLQASGEPAAYAPPGKRSIDEIDARANGNGADDGAHDNQERENSPNER